MTLHTQDGFWARATGAAERRSIVAKEAIVDITDDFMFDELGVLALGL
jgi:hypothetical protein